MIRILSVVLLAVCAPGAQAQSPYPNKFVRLVIPFPAATSPDVVMRLVGPQLSQMWGQQVVIENRVGAAGNIGAANVATATPDGYTLLYTVNSVVCANPHLYSKMTFDPMKQLAPISLVANLGYVLIGSNKLPAKDLNELIALAKAQPGKLTYSSSGVGVGTHIVMELLLGQTGTSMLHVPMNTPATAAVFSGETDLTMSPYTTGIPAAKSGKARAYGVTLAKRAAALPDVPAIGEAVPGYVGDAWHGLFAPTGTPQAIIDKVAADTAKVLAMPDVREKLAAIGLEPVGNTPAEFAAIVRRDYEKWGKVIRDANIKLD
ncbi:MAG TPA: tripartite tricarboxylate transporter substrate binding protein [Burkholderiales bacterium]|nr:tripartite tricarboxylate transporter substrate binding protein [Burkholderiales bacterium]